MSTRRSSRVPSDTASRLHGRDSNFGSTTARIFQHAGPQQQHQQQAGADRRKASTKDGGVVGAGSATASVGTDSIFSSMPQSLALPQSLAAAFELPGIHISRIETLDFDDDAVSRWARR